MTQIAYDTNDLLWNADDADLRSRMKTDIKSASICVAKHQRY